MMILENVIASLALMETSVKHVPRNFLVLSVKVFIYFQCYYYCYYFLFTISLLDTLQDFLIA